jgi:murein DD-endopeptidase MepM/ murein hydrolase activator NlpD
MRRLAFLIVVLLFASVAVLAQESGTTYIVQPGDTLGRIAARFGVTAREIAEANQLPSVDLIYAGQVLIIPGVTPTPSAPPPSTGVAPQSTATAIFSPEMTLEATAEAVPFPEVTAAPFTGDVAFELGGEVISFAYPELMRRATMTWAKSDIYWTLDAGAVIAQGAIDAARANGFRILLSVHGDPAVWAADPAAYNAAFAQFLAAVAALNPDAIEVWHSQNVSGTWAADRVSAADYSAMLRAAYSAIKTVNPAVMVISGAPVLTPLFASCTAQGCEDAAFMQQMADAGAANYADCIGVQYTAGALPPDATTGDVRLSPEHHSYYFPALIEAAAAAFPDKPLCITRIGYLTGEGLPALPSGYEWAQTTSLAEQAEWLAQAAITARNDGRVQLMIVWNVDATSYDAEPQAGYAIVRADGECIACIALNAAMRSP